jgi:hypothetical protein
LVGRHIHGGGQHQLKAKEPPAPYRDVVAVDLRPLGQTLGLTHMQDRLRSVPATHRCRGHLRTAV